MFIPHGHSLISAGVDVHWDCNEIHLMEEDSCGSMFSPRPPFLYMVHLGFAYLRPVFLSSLLKLSEIGEDQGPDGLHTFRFSARNITYMRRRS